ncbi:uncharacterized protein LOC144149026 [Haemaphysalis longicornis]
MMEELATEIRVALPSITDHHMTRLMRDLTDKGVHSKEDMFKVGAVDLVNALGTEKAKKLVAYFNAKRGLCGPNTLEVSTEVFVEALGSSYAQSTKLDEDHVKRQGVYQETLRILEEHGQRVGNFHDTLESIKKIQEEAVQAHEAALRNIRGYHKQPVERGAPCRHEVGDEARQLAKSSGDQAGLYEPTTAQPRKTKMDEVSTKRQDGNEGTPSNLGENVQQVAGIHDAGLMNKQIFQSNSPRADKEEIGNLPQDRQREEKGPETGAEKPQPEKLLNDEGGLYKANPTKARTNESAGALADGDDVQRKLDEEHSKRQDLYKETPRNVEENAQRFPAIHTAALEDIKKSQAAASRAHRERLQNITDRHRLLVERNQPGKRGRQEEMRQLAKPSENQVSAGSRSILATLLQFFSCNCSSRQQDSN